MFLAITLQKPKENQCFSLWGPMGTPWGPMGPPWGPLGPNGARPMCLCATQKHHIFCQNDPKIKNATKWVAMAPFGAFRAAARSYGPPGAIGTPPGPPNGQNDPPQRGIAILGVWGGDTSGVGVGATARPPTRRVCWLGPEPQGTPKPTFLPPNGSPCHHLDPSDRPATELRRGSH